MKELSIDIETYSSEDLLKTGFTAMRKPLILQSCFLPMLLMTRIFRL